MTQELTLSIYNRIGWITMGIAAAVLLVSPLIKRLMHLDTLEDDQIPGQEELAEPQAAGVHPAPEGAR